MVNFCLTKKIATSLSICQVDVHNRRIIVVHTRHPIFEKSVPRVGRVHARSMKAVLGMQVVLVLILTMMMVLMRGRGRSIVSVVSVRR
jgi:hypothetical protein